MKFGKEYVLCSRFKGKLVDDAGQPVAGVRIERTWRWTWTKESGSDHATTDKDGLFALPRVTGRSFSAGLFMHEPVVGQEITALGPDGSVVLWSYVKRDYDDNSELGGRPLDVICGLDQPPPGEVLYTGTCVEARATTSKD